MRGESTFPEPVGKVARRVTKSLLIYCLVKAGGAINAYYSDREPTRRRRKELTGNESHWRFANYMVYIFVK
jgi:hypothetical protein